MTTNSMTASKKEVLDMVYFHPALTRTDGVKIPATEILRIYWPIFRFAGLEHVGLPAYP